MHDPNYPPGTQPPHAQPTAAPQAPTAAGIPQVVLPDQALVDSAIKAAQDAAARAAAARSGGTGAKAPFFSPLGPNGETKWGQSSVPINYSKSYTVWLMPSSVPGQMPYVVDQSHFVRTQEHPQGRSLGHVDGQCFFCTARDMLFKSGSEADYKRAKSNGRLGRRALYQILLLDEPESHIREDGRMSPWIFRAPGGLHDDIVDKIFQLSPMRLLDVQHGRPLIITKKKTGPEAMNVEWKVDVTPDAQPLHSWFYPAFENLHDVSKFVKAPTLKEQFDAINGAGFPMPPELPGLVQQEQANVQHAQQPAYTSGHAPPHANPYGQQPAPPAASPHPQGSYVQQPPQAGYPQPAPVPPSSGVAPQLAALQNQMKG